MYHSPKLRSHEALSHKHEMKNSQTHTFAHLCQILHFSLSLHSKVTVSKGEMWLYNFQSGNEMVNTDSW